MTDLREIVDRLGGELYAGGRAAVVPGPGHSRRDRSLSLRLSEDGARVIFYSHAGDTPRACMEHLGIEARHSDSRSGREEQERLRKAREAAQRKEEAEALEFCRSIWDGTGPVEGSPVEAYLWGRGLVADGIGDLRFHAAAPRSRHPQEGEELRTAPAMVALVRDAKGSPRGLHVTFIKDDGSDKAFGPRSRIMFGPVAGGAVRLGNVGPDRRLALAEGIETAGSYATLNGVVTWAALSTAGIRNFVVPVGIRELIVAADADENGAGINAAVHLAERAQRICDVRVDAPTIGKDWNDVLREQNLV